MLGFLGEQQRLGNDADLPKTASGKSTDKREEKQNLLELFK